MSNELDLSLGVNDGGTFERVNMSAAALKASVLESGKAVLALGSALQALNTTSPKGAAAELAELRRVLSDISSSADALAASIPKALEKGLKEAKASARKGVKDIAAELQAEQPVVNLRVSVSPLVLPGGARASLASGVGIDSAEGLIAEQKKLMAETGAMSAAQIAKWDASQKAVDDGRKLAGQRTRATIDATAAAEIAEWDKAQKAIDDGRKLIAARSIATTNDLSENYLKGVKREQAELAAAIKLRAAQEIQEWDAAQKAIDEGRILAAQRSRAVASALAKEQASIQSRDIAVLGRTGQAQITQAMASPSGAFSIASGQNIGRVVDTGAIEAQKALRAEADALSSSLKAQAGHVGALGQMFKGHIVDTNDLHSAYRGLASGFGAMWLTWGNILPLLAGAAIGHAAARALHIGSEVGQSLAVIQHLGGATNEEMVELNKTLLETASKGPFGPKEVAKALETLSLAGLNARQQMEALKPTLDFAVAGQMPIEKAASALIAVSTAFGYQARDMSVVSDVIAKTAAISMASTEGMAASFKVASVVAQQYGVSIEDVATSLALLAQVGIKESAAGTSVRQMYSELIGSSEKARRIMKEVLKFDAFDDLGKNLKPLPQIFNELAASFVNLNAKSQNRLLLDMGNERGTKAIAANLRAVQVETQKTASEFEAMGLSVDEAMTKSREKVVSNMEKIRKEIADAPGFSALAAIGLAGSSENQMKSVLASLQTSLVGAFQAAEPVIARVAWQLQEMFKSEGFKTGLTALIVGIADLTGFLTKNFDVLAVGTLGYVAGTMAVTAYTTVSALMTVAATEASFALAAGAVASEAAAIGVASSGVAAGTAAVGFGALATAMLPLTLLIAAVGGAYWYLTQKTDESRVAKENAEAVTARTMDAVKTESERLRVLIEAKGDEAIAREETGRVLQANTLAAINGAGMEKIKVLQLSSGYDDLARAKDKALGGWDAMGNYTGIVDGGAAERLKGLDEQIAAIKAVTAAEVAASQAEFKLLTDRAATAKKIADVRRAKVTPQGSGVYDGLEKKRGTRKAQDPDFADARGELAAIQREYKAQTDAMALETKASLDTQKFYYASGISTFANYQAQMTGIQNQEFDKRRQALQDEIAAMQAARAKLIEAGSRDPQKAGKLDNALKEYETVLANLDNQMAKLNEANVERLRSAFLEAGRAGIDSIKSSDVTLAKLKEEVAIDVEKLSIKKDVVSMTERQSFAQEKVLAGTKLTREALVKEQAILETMTKAGFFKQMGEDSEDGRAATAIFERMSAYIAKLQEQLRTAGGQIGEAASKLFDDTKTQAFAKELNTKLVDALVDAGKGGGKQMRDFVEQELIRRPFKLFLQGVLSGVTGSVAGFLTGNAGGGAGGTGGTVGTVGTAAGGLMGLANGASSLGTMYTAGSYLASGATGTMVGSAAGMGATLPGAAVGVGALAGGTGVGGMASSLGAVFASNPVGWIALAAIAAYAVFSKEAKPSSSTGDAAMAFDAAGKQISKVDNTRASYAAKDSAAYDSIVTGLQADYARAAVSLGIKAVESGFGFAGNTGKGGEEKNIAIIGTAGGSKYESGEVKDTPENMKLLSARAVLAALEGSELPKYLKGVFAGIDPGKQDQAQLDTLMVKAQALKTFNDQLLKMPFASLADLSYEATQAMATAAGGLSNLGAALVDYHKNYYSQAEQTATTTQQISDALSKVNIEMPKTRAEFRAQMDAQIALKDAGAPAVSALLSVQAAFAGIVPAALDAAAATSNAANTMAQAAAAMNAKISAVIADYASNSEVRTFQAGEVQRTLAGGGVNLSVEQILAASRSDARALYDSFNAAAGQNQTTEQAAAQSAILDAAKTFTALTPVAQAQAQSSSSSGSSGSSAASSIASAWKSIVDSLWGEVKRIKGLMQGTGTDALANAQAEFAIATAQARAGDEAAAKTLPQLSAALLTLAENNAGTLLELRRIQGQTAGSLFDTGSQLSASHGLAIPAFASGGDHAGGWAMVGEEGPELAYLPPARIYTAGETSGMQGGSNAEMAASFRRMADRLDLIEANTRAGAQHGAKSARILERVTPDGDALQTRTIV